MNRKPGILSYKPLYLPALIIVAAVLILLLVIAISTYRNLDTAQVRTEEMLQREGRVLIHSLAAALKAGFPLAPPDSNRLDKLLADMARDTDIHSLMIIDTAGRLIASASRPVPPDALRGGASLTMLLGEKGMVTRYGNDTAGQRIYEIIQPLRTYLSSSSFLPFLSVRPEAPESARRGQVEEPLVRWSKDKIIALSFRLQVFETARQADFNHVVLMGAILIILATGTLYFIFVVQKYYLDINALKESVRRSERLASLGRLAAGIAHEIRNPLSSIRGFAQFFQKRFAGHEEEQEYATIMVREVDRLNRVITELLDFARPRELRRTPCSLPKIIDDTLQLLAMELTAKGVVVDKDYAAKLPLVQADQEQLSQALLNLLLNALQALEKGGKISIGLTQHPGRLTITCADNGCGIPPGDREKIFEPFFSSKPRGTGLGLAIVHQIVENHGGEIRVINRPGGGTVFSIDLPVESGPKAATPAQL